MWKSMPNVTVRTFGKIAPSSMPRPSGLPWPSVSGSQFEKSVKVCRFWTLM
jgi:hypothetical protein